MRSMTLCGLSAGLLAALAVRAAPMGEVTYTGTDEVVFVARESSVGSSLNRAHVESKATKKDSQLIAFTDFANEALGTCGAIKAIRFEPLSSPDSFGGSSARLKGLGVYASFSDSSVRGGRSVGLGESFLAPYASLKVAVEAADGSKGETDVVAFTKVIADPDKFSRTEFLSMDAEKVQETALSVAKPRVIKAIQDLTKGKCP